MSNDFVLADGCRPLIEADDITVFMDENEIERAVFRVDGNQDPLPHCDPNSFGYALVMVNFIDASEGVAVCEVVELAALLNYGKDFEAEVIGYL